MSFCQWIGCLAYSGEKPPYLFNGEKRLIGIEKKKKLLSFTPGMMAHWYSQRPQEKRVRDRTALVCAR